MPRNIEARKVLVSHSGPRGMTAAGGEEGLWAMSVMRRGCRLKLGRGCGGVDRMLAVWVSRRFNSLYSHVAKSPTLHPGELPIDGYRITVSQDELMCGEGSMGGLDH